MSARVSRTTLRRAGQACECQPDLGSVSVCVRLKGRLRETLGPCQSEGLLNMSSLEHRAELTGVIPGHTLPLLCRSVSMLLSVLSFLSLRSNIELILCLFLGAKARGGCVFASVCVCVCVCQLRLPLLSRRLLYFGSSCHSDPVGLSVCLNQ